MYSLFQTLPNIDYMSVGWVLTGPARHHTVADTHKRIGQDSIHVRVAVGEIDNQPSPFNYIYLLSERVRSPFGFSELVI